MLFSIKVALRFLKEGKNQTYFILISIVLGVAVQVFLSGLIRELNRNLTQSTIGRASQLTVEAKDINKQEKKQYINEPLNRNTIQGYEKMVEGLENIKEIIAVSPTVQGNASYIKGNVSQAIQVKGLDLEKADSIYKFKDSILEGIPVISSDQVLIGEEFAQENRVGVGDSVSLTFQGNNTISFFVSGIFDLENEQANTSLVVMDLARSQKIFALGSGVNTIETQLLNPYASQKVAEKVKAYMPKVKISVWQDKNKSLLNAIRGQQSSSSVIQIFIIFSIALSMSSVLVISVIQKSKEIGILKAMGSTNYQTSMIFIIQGATLAFIGSIGGYILGLGITKFFFDFLNEANGANYIFAPNLSDFLLTIFAATIIGILASLVPAKKSEGLNPMEVIRGV